MPAYRYCNLTIRSNERLVQLEEFEALAADSSCDITFRQGQIEPAIETKALANGTSLSWYKTEAATVVLFRDQIEFCATTASESILVTRSQDTPLDIAAQVLLDQILPRWLAMQDNFLVHASGIRVNDGQAVLFLGPSGSGKSSLAASLMQETTLLGDDCFDLQLSRLGAVEASSSYPSLRLLPNSYQRLVPSSVRTGSTEPSVNPGEKLRINLDPAGTGPAPVSAIFVIDEVGHTGTAHVNELSTRDQTLALVRNSFRIDVSDAQTMTTAFELASALAAQVQILQLSYERSFDALDAVHKTIFAALDEKAALR